jgi:hypothetical protein
MSTNFANNGIENAIVIDKDELSPENTAARPRKRRRTGERDGKISMKGARTLAS